MRPTQDAQLVFAGFISLPNPLTGGPFRLMAGIPGAVLAVTKIILTNTDPNNANSVQLFSPDALTFFGELPEAQPSTFPFSPNKISLPAGGSYIWNALDNGVVGSGIPSPTALLVYPGDIIAGLAKNSPPNLTLPNQPQPQPSLVFCNIFAIINRDATVRPHYQQDILDEAIGGGGLRQSPDLYVDTTDTHRDLRVMEDEVQEILRRLLVEVKRTNLILVEGFADIDYPDDADNQDFHEETETEDG